MPIPDLSKSAFRSIRSGGLAAAVVAALLLGCANQYTELYPFKTAVKVQLEDKATVAARMRPVPIPRNDRVDRIVELFREVGCKELRREKVTGSPTPNVVCRLRGRSPRRIVVAAHHVLARGGKGIFDDWSGTVLLPALYASLKDVPHDHTYEFIAFASTTLEGDASYARLRGETEAQRNQIVAMIWLDFLGSGQPATWPERSDPNLRVDLESAAKSIGVQVDGRDLLGASTIHDLSRAYRWYKIPTLFVHSIRPETQRFLNEPKWDIDPDNLDYDAYFDTYRALAVFLGYLDRTAIARRL